MKENKSAGHNTSNALDKKGKPQQAHQSLKTEYPLAEKDEVKQAEDNLRNPKTKPLQRKLRIL